MLRAAGLEAFHRVFHRQSSSRIDGEVPSPHHQNLPRSRGTCQPTRVREKVMVFCALSLARGTTVLETQCSSALGVSQVEYRSSQTTYKFLLTVSQLDSPFATLIRHGMSRFGNSRSLCHLSCIVNNGSPDVVSSLLRHVFSPVVPRSSRGWRSTGGGVWSVGPLHASVGGYPVREAAVRELVSLQRVYDMRSRPSCYKGGNTVEETVLVLHTMRCKEADRKN